MSEPIIPQNKPPFEETEAYKEAIALSQYFEQVMDAELKKSEIAAVLCGIEMDWQSIRAMSAQSNEEKLNEYLAQLRCEYEAKR